MIADAGYGSEENNEFMEQNDIEALTKKGTRTRISDNGYKSNVSYYQAANCKGFPLKGQCHKAKGNRTLEVNFRLKELKQKARELLISEKGLYHRG